MSREIATLGDLPRIHAAKRGDRRALLYGERSWTFAELDAASNRVAQALRAQGIRRGDRVAYLDKNSPEYFLLLFGAAKLNAVTVAVNWRLAPPEMAYVIDDAGAKLLALGDEFLGHLASMKIPKVEKVVVIGKSGEHEDFEGWMAAHPADDPHEPLAPDDTCYQLYTSGTTGHPKGVELTNRNFFSMLPTASTEWSFDETSVNLVAMPLFHIAGSGWAVVGLFNGCESVLLREVDPGEILRLIPAQRITNALFVPAVLQVLLAQPGVETIDFDSLRIIVYGASPITESVLARSMETFGCGFAQAYGLTETTGGATILRPTDHDPGGPRAKLLRSAGQPWGDVELQIVDTETAAVLPDGKVGEIWIKSVQNMKGYWKNDAATLEAFPGERGSDGLGWFRTGDAGYLEDGYLYIHDRVKDMIVSGGENVYPAEVENALMAHADVADCAVIGVPHDKWGETVKALIVPAPDADPSEAVLIEHCRGLIARYKCPTSVERVAEIPRNPSGKVLKTVLRKPYWEGRDRFVH